MRNREISKKLLAKRTKKGEGFCKLYAHLIGGICYYNTCKYPQYII